jgi:hypothetical protein
LDLSLHGYESNHSAKADKNGIETQNENLSSLPRSRMYWTFCT